MNACFNVLKKGRHLSVTLEMNLLRAATLPVSFWTSLMVLGEAISMMAYTFSRFASIPLWDTMNPKNLPEATPKTHLPVFSFI